MESIPRLRSTLWPQHCRQRLVQPTATALYCLSIHPTHNVQPLSLHQRIPKGQRRLAHTRRHVSSVATAVDLPELTRSTPPKGAMTTSKSMSVLPLHTLIRSYMITAVSSVPFLLRPSLAVLAYLSRSKSKILHPDSNPVLKMLLKKTFYSQFCAGEKPAEVRQTLRELKSMGFKGVMLVHAREVVLSKEEEAGLSSAAESAEQDALNREEVAAWTKSTLDTIALSEQGDFVSLKFTGAGRQALQRLKETASCAPALENALHQICQAAERQGISLLIDAEQASLQRGIDAWTMALMRAYNRGDKALVYGTYQTYAKNTPSILAEHLAEATKNNFVLGVKLVRGAYLGSDPRELFWDTIEETHQCFDSLAECVIRRQYGGLLQPTVDASNEFPRVDLALASHNVESVRRARQIRDEQARLGTPRIRLAYGQLMGMADNVSCELVHEARERASTRCKDADRPETYKYVVWGTMGECMNYLVRRAQENKEAVARTITARQALGRELLRRMGIS